jgi:uroporphyrinogen-III synthase
VTIVPALDGRRVIVTRPERPDGPLAAALIRAGAKAISLPLLTIERVIAADLEGMNLDDYDHILFTSANGVVSFAEQLRPAALAKLKQHTGIAVIGPATRKALEACGAAAAHTAQEHVAESLVTSLGDVGGRRLLWPRAESVRGVLAESLRAGGADLTEIIVYRSVVSIPADAGIAIQGADAVTFTSPSGVRAWSSAFGTPHMRVVCIGPVTARAATGAGFRVDAVADPYTIDGVMTALCRAFHVAGPVS